MQATPRKGKGRVRRVLLGGLMLICIACIFGLSRSETAALQTFGESVDRWQVNPDFRIVAIDYSIQGSAAVRCEPFGIRGADLIIALRSTPGLPKEFAVCETSRPHYESFASGPLAAYLYLGDEQDVPGYIEAVEQLASKATVDETGGRTWGEPALKEWMDARKMDFTICRDDGALRSLAALAADVQPGQTFSHREVMRAKKLHMSSLLEPHIASLATELDFPTSPRAMTAEQQQVVLSRLDGHVRRHDPELWRTKQVSDFAAGIWAQVYGSQYNYALAPLLALKTGAGWVLVAILAWLAFRAVRRSSETSDETTPDSEGDDLGPIPQPTPAV